MSGGFDGDDKDTLMYQQTEEWDEGVQAIADATWVQLDLSGADLAIIKEVHLRAPAIDFAVSRRDSPASGGFPVGAGALHVIAVNAPNQKVWVAGLGGAGNLHWEALGFKSAPDVSEKQWGS